MIVVRRHHDLGLTEARRLAETMALRLRGDYGGSFAWRGDELHFRRTGVSGLVGVTKDSVEIRVELGLLLRPLRGRIEREICAFCDEQFGEPEVPERPRSARRAARPVKD